MGAVENKQMGIGRSKREDLALKNYITSYEYQNLIKETKEVLDNLETRTKENERQLSLL